MIYEMEVLVFKESGKFLEILYYKTTEDFMFKIVDDFKDFGFLSSDKHYVFTGSVFGGNSHPNGYPCLIKG